jgi:signal transduction histidine kinase
LPPDVKAALYRIVQEALNNIAKHAGASEVLVSLRCQPEEVWLQIRDNGRGFDPDSVSADHLGLGIMRERIETIGATLKIESQSGQGTEVVVTWQNSSKARRNV